MDISFHRGEDSFNHLLGRREVGLDGKGHFGARVFPNQKALDLFATQQYALYHGMSGEEISENDKNMQVRLLQHLHDYGEFPQISAPSTPEELSRIERQFGRKLTLKNIAKDKGSVVDGMRKFGNLLVEESLVDIITNGPRNFMKIVESKGVSSESERQEVKQFLRELFYDLRKNFSQENSNERPLLRIKKFDGDTQFKRSNNTIHFNPYAAHASASPFIVFCHEAAHAIDYGKDRIGMLVRLSTPNEKFTNDLESDVIVNREHMLSRACGFPCREYHADRGFSSVRDSYANANEGRFINRSPDRGGGR